MSWSFSHKGKPAEITAALETYGGGLSGQSKIEFDEARPHLAGLVNQNLENRPDREPPTLAVSAYGSGSAQGDQQLERSCTVKIERSS